VKDAIHPAALGVGGSWDRCLCLPPAKPKGWGAVPVGAACAIGCLSAGMQLPCRTALVNAAPSFSSWHTAIPPSPGLGCT